MLIVAKDVDFKFGMHAPRDSRDRTVDIFFERGRGHGHVTP